MEQQVMNVIKIALKLVSAELLNFETTSIADNLVKMPPIETYEYKTNVQFSVDSLSKSITITVNVQILNIITKEEYGHIDTQFSFYIDNFEETVIRVEDGKIVYLPYAFNMCGGVAVSTTRGLLITAVSKSKISNALLPLMDAGNFLPPTEDLQLNLH